MSLNCLTVVKPIAVTPSMLISTDVPETDYAEWAAGTTYAIDDRVIVAAQHKIYQSAVAANVGKDPATDRAAWLEVGATNRWKPYDKSVSSQVVQVDAISYRIKPGQAVTSVGVLNITGGTSLRSVAIRGERGSYNESPPRHRKSRECSYPG